MSIDLDLQNSPYKHLTDKYSLVTSVPLDTVTFSTLSPMSHFRLPDSRTKTPWDHKRLVDLLLSMVLSSLRQRLYSVSFPLVREEPVTTTLV